MKQVEKSTGKTPPDLINAPTLSECHNDVWKAYTTLSVFSYQEIDAYVRLTGLLLTPWEIEAIMILSQYRESEPKWPI